MNPNEARIAELEAELARLRMGNAPQQQPNQTQTAQTQSVHSKRSNMPPPPQRAAGQPNYPPQQANTNAPPPAAPPMQTQQKPYREPTEITSQPKPLPNDFQKNKPLFNPPGDVPCSVLELVFKGDQNLIEIYRKVVNYNNMEILYDTDCHPRSGKACFNLISAQGPTITFIFSEDACCGGYLSQSWVNPEGCDMEVTDKDAFLFSLVHPNKAYPQDKFPVNSPNRAGFGSSLSQSDMHGPGFGYSGTLLGALFIKSSPTGLYGVSNFTATHTYNIPRNPQFGLLGKNDDVPLTRFVVCALNDLSDTVATQLPPGASVDMLTSIFTKKTAVKIYKTMIGITKLEPLYDSNIHEKTKKAFFEAVSKKGPVVIIMGTHVNSFFGAVTSVPIPAPTNQTIQVRDDRMYCFAFGPQEYFYPGTHPIDPKNAENAMFIPTARDTTMGLGFGKNGGTGLVTFSQNTNELPSLTSNIHSDNTFAFNTKFFNGFYEKMKITRYFVAAYNPANIGDIPPEPPVGEAEQRIAQMLFKGDLKLACRFTHVTGVTNPRLIYDTDVNYRNSMNPDQASEIYINAVNTIKPTLFVVFGPRSVFGMVTNLTWPTGYDTKTEECDPDGYAFTLVHPCLPPERFPLRKDAKASIVSRGHMRLGPRFGCFGEFCAVTFTTNLEAHPTGLFGVAHIAYPRDYYRFPRLAKTLLGAPPGNFCTTIYRFFVCTF